ncbi:MAG TPA: hypothetical protein VFJ85_02390 [Acidimicrobiales bacterium]|nr:hypothetical protein [Acidimicrobiales bacterium]
MGLLDRAKKLAEQALDVAKEKAEEARRRAESSKPVAPPPDDRYGTPYVPGMFGQPGWRELDLVDPAGILLIGERDRAGIPHSTKSVLLEEPFGMGRRWTSGDRSAGLYYRLTPEQRAWEPPSPAPYPGVHGAVGATLDDGRTVVLFGNGQVEVVVETSGLDAGTVAALVSSAAAELRSS